MAEVRLRTGITVHTETAGDPKGPAVLFANGLTMDTTAWEGVVAALPERYATVRFDARGQGASDKPAGPYTPEQHADDLLALIDTLGLDAVHLVGLSNGGLVSMLAAGRAPERVRSLTLIDTFPRVDAFLRAVLRGWRAAILAGGSGLRFDVATPWVWGQAFLDAHEEEVLAFRERAAATDPRPVLELIQGLLEFAGDARQTLHRYEGPLAVLVGDDDVLTPLRFAREIVQAAQRGRLEVVGDAGHAAPIERPDEIARILTDELAKADGGSA